MTASPLRLPAALRSLFRPLLDPYRRYRHAKLIHAARVALSVLVSIALSTGLNIPHGEWSSITVLIVFGGLLFARLLSQVLINASEANSIRGGRGVAASAYIVVVGYSALAALEQIGARPTLVISAAQILLGSLGLALAIAFGLGAKDIAADILRGVLKRGR